MARVVTTPKFMSKAREAIANEEKYQAIIVGITSWCDEQLTDDQKESFASMIDELEVD